MSSHLHQWIDLIFGFRQQGPAAVESVNMFHPYFYIQRGRQNPKDPLIRSTILGYVSNFGQVPKQVQIKCWGSRESTWSPACRCIILFLEYNLLVNRLRLFHSFSPNHIPPAVALRKRDRLHPIQLHFSSNLTN